MTYFITFFLGGWNFLYAFSKKNKRIIAFLLMCFAWILFWGNTQNPDYHNYLRHYTNIQHGASIFTEYGSEFGFRMIMKLGALFGLSYEVFLALITICSYLMIHKTVKQFSENYNYVYLLYFIFPFFLDVVQLRNFIAMSIFIFSIRYLMDKSLIGKIKYFLWIFVAATIHYTAILYLPFLLINVKKKNRLVLFIAIFSIMSSVIIVMNDKNIPFIQSLVNFIIDSDKVLNWFDSRTNWGFILFWFLQTLSFTMVKISRGLFHRNISKETNGLDKTEFNKELYEKKLKFMNLVYWINIMAFMYFPFYILASTFTRLMRNLMLLNYISFSITNHVILKRDEKVLFNILVLVYVAIFFAFQLLQYKETIIDSILKYNLLF